MNSELEERACQYVLDQLSARERAAFEKRMFADPALLTMVRQAEAGLEAHVRHLPSSAIPEGALARIQSRIAHLSDHGAGSQVAPLSRGKIAWQAIAGWGIAAVATVSLSILAVQSLRQRPAPANAPFVVLVTLGAGDSHVSEVPFQNVAGDSDRSFMQLASLAEQYWKKSDNLPHTGRPARSSAEGHGYALYDPASNQGFVAVQDLPVAQAGEQYHLWIVDSSTGKIRDAGIIPLTDSERGLYSFSVAEPPVEGQPRRVGFFITAEKSGSANPTRPHGKVVLGDIKI